MALEGIERIHLIGIGGIGISGVARFLHARGFTVQGSDVRASSITQALESEGMEVFIGHDPRHLSAVDLVIYSTAIPKTNCELKAAQEKGIPLLHRAQILGELVDRFESIGVLGTHGKGTVAAMITWILERQGLDPSFYIGGIVNNYGTNLKVGSGPNVVVEVDESDGSHHHIMTTYGIINNIDLDHLNYYQNLDDIIANLREWIVTNKRLTTLLVNGDDPGCQMLLSTLELPVGLVLVTYGRRAENQYQALNLQDEGMRGRFEIARGGEILGAFEINLPGEYNIENATGAIALGHWLDIPLPTIQLAMESFSGIENRFTLSRVAEISIVKDYISHPTGIRRVLAAARCTHPRKVYAVFKPYRFTLIHYLRDEYQVAFQDADEVVVTEMYTAGEVPIPGVDEESFIQSIQATGKDVDFVKEMDAIPGFLQQRLAPGDLVVFLGGDDLFEQALRLETLLGGQEEDA